MAKITLPPLPREGENLLANRTISDVDDPYTRSVYANLGAPDREGLISTLNGRLTYPNLNENFRLEDYHIQPEQASLARTESMLDSATIFGDGIPNLVEDSNFFTLPGCSLRWYQPYATSVSLMQWSFFLSYNLWRGVYKDMDGDVRGVNTPILLRCRLDDTVVPSSTRHLGQNMFHPVSPGAPDRTDQTGPGVNSFDLFKETPSEAHTASQFDLHHTAALAKGFHEISVECSMTLPEGVGVYLQNLGAKDKTFVTGRGYFNLVGKVSLGIRNARVLNLL